MHCLTSQRQGCFETEKKKRSTCHLVGITSEPKVRVTNIKTSPLGFDLKLPSSMTKHHLNIQQRDEYLRYKKCEHKEPVRP